MSKVKVVFPKKLVTLFVNDVMKDVIGAHGGRGSGKSRNFAKATAIRAYQFAQANIKGVILCAREYMNSLADSSMGEVKTAIESEPWLAAYFEIGETYIRTKNRRVSYIFSGLRLNLNSLKSKHKILLCWVDEAEDVSEIAWSKLIPTLREEGYYPDGSYWKTQLWITWNPEKEGSATDERFRKNADEGMHIIEMNYKDNEFFPQILEATRQRDEKTLDAETYAWIWEGDYLRNSNKQVLGGKAVCRVFADDLWEKADRLFYGADFGFADDPSTLIRSFIIGNTLYIDYEAYGKHVELDDMWKFYAGNDGMNAKQATEWKINDHMKWPGVPDSRKWPIKGDSSRPETISHIKKAGFNISAAKKWQGSVEDGVAYLRKFDEIVIHPRCKETWREARLYSYKVDNNGEVLPIIVDKFNHCMDALRYGHDGMITKKGKGIFG